MSRTKPEFPDYYLYKKDGDWFKTDDALTRQINDHIRGSSAISLPRMEFLPNWKAEGLHGAKYVAWRVNEFGEQVIRWYWQVTEHSKKHKNCIKLDNGRCGVKVPAIIEWNDALKMWQLAPMHGKASEDEAKVLDKR